MTALYLVTTAEREWLVTAPQAILAAEAIRDIDPSASDAPDAFADVARLADISLGMAGARAFDRVSRASETIPGVRILGMLTPYRGMTRAAIAQTEPPTF